MKKEDLPISPHLQIYKPQITSLLSISHRVTGFALNFSLIILVSGLLCITLGEVYFLLFIEILNTIPTISEPAQITNKGRLIKIVDVLGRISNPQSKSPLFYIYEDGTVEKIIIME